MKDKIKEEDERFDDGVVFMWDENHEAGLEKDFRHFKELASFLCNPIFVSQDKEAYNWLLAKYSQPERVVLLVTFILHSKIFVE